MSGSAVERLELENGVTLGETMQYGSYELTKDEARTVFFGTVSDINCRCLICKETGEDHNDEFEVERGNNCISIGCADFNPDQVAAVKKWLDGGK